MRQRSGKGRTPTRLRAFLVTLGLVLGSVGVEAAVAPTPAHASAVNYYLPYTAGVTAVMTQGPGGSTSHTGTNAHAYDFDLNGGSVRASAPGTIIGKVSGQTGQTGPGNSGNYVLLKHADNTCTRYAHMAYGSVTTKSVGDTVGQAEILGSEGNTGYTLPVGGGHHLHFQRENCSWNSIAVDFVENDWTSQNNAVAVPTDSDGDGTPDSSDACPNHVGPSSLGGCPDTDSDGFHNAVDECDDIPGVGYQQGCRQPMATMRGDYNGDGDEDVASFYVYPERGSAMSLFVWDGDGSGAISSTPRLAYYDASGWGSDRVIPAGSGDFNEDGMTDIAIFYRYPNTVVRSITWYAQTDGSFDMTVTSVDTAMEGANLIPVGTGDYNGNGTIDLASLYRYPERGNALSLIVWEGDGAGGFAAGVAKWYNATGWDGHLIVPIGSGEFFTDGRTDITVFYDYGDGVTRMLTWYGRADGTFYDPAVTFYASSGWNGRHLIPAGVGDFDGDGKDDVASFYGYPERGNAIGLFIWKGNGDGTFQGPQLSWYTPTGWWWLLLIPAGVSDLDGNGRDELSMFFDYGASTVRLFTWSPDSSGDTTDPAIQYYATDMAGAHLRP